MPLPILLVAAPVGILAWTLLNHDEETQIQRGRAALRELLNRAARAGGKLTGEPAIIRNAMHVPAIGKIDFRWGYFDEKKGEGSGISKVIGAQKLKREYYNDPVFTQRFVVRIPDILARGKASKVGKTRMKITHGKDFVFLEKDFDGQPSNNWVLNAYQCVPGKNLSTKQIAKLLNAAKQKKGGR